MRKMGNNRLTISSLYGQGCNDMTSGGGEIHFSLANDWVVSRYGYGLSDGGCLAIARALAEVTPGAKIATILRDSRPDHYGVALPDGRLVDAEGVYGDADAWVACFYERELIPKGSSLSFEAKFTPSDEVPDSQEVKKGLVAILKRFQLARPG
jgi:hypothetical protein